MRAPLGLRCGCRYGATRRKLIYGRLKGHTGQHALRLSVTELAYVMALRSTP